MPENVLKMPRSASPVARTGAGDISERELTRERHNLQSTPPARLQPVHPKKQLFLTPVGKFTCKPHSPAPHLARIRSCLEELTAANTATQSRRVKMPPKSNSMEDLTPTKRMRKENPKTEQLPIIRSPSQGVDAGAAAARVARFMVLCAWRRRRDEVRCLRKTLEFQVSCSERLRMQVVALKSLLDSDNAKVRMAMRELERLKQLVRDKDKEKAVLEREKLALEDDVCAAEDRTSEMSIGWRNCRNELEVARAASARLEHAGALERAQRDHACLRLSAAEEELAQLEEQLSSAEEEAEVLRAELAESQEAHDAVCEELAKEKNVRLACGLEIASLNMRVSRAGEDSETLKAAVSDLQVQLEEARLQLQLTREQLDWWPKPLTKLVGAMRWWVRRPSSLRAAFLWSCVPPTHGATQFTHTLYLI